MSRLKMAVVGCGHLGTIHARLLAGREDAELVAVVDPSPAARDRVAAAHGCRGLACPQELVGLVDAAVVASPTGLHAASSVPLLEAGIDVLVEKPIAASRREAEAIVDVTAGTSLRRPAGEAVRRAGRRRRGPARPRRAARPSGFQRPSSPRREPRFRRSRRRAAGCGCGRP